MIDQDRSLHTTICWEENSGYDCNDLVALTDQEIENVNGAIAPVVVYVAAGAAAFAAGAAAGYWANRDRRRRRRRRR